MFFQECSINFTSSLFTSSYSISSLTSDSIFWLSKASFTVVTFILPLSITFSRFSILLIKASLLSSNIGWAIFIIVTSATTLGFEAVFILSWVVDNIFSILIKSLLFIVSACDFNCSMVSSGKEIISSKSVDTLHIIRFLKWSIKSFIKFLISFPHTINSFKILSDSFVSWFIIYCAKSNNCSTFTVPNNSTTSLYSILLSPKEIHWSNMLRASLRAPCEFLAIKLRAFSSTSIFSSTHIFFILDVMSFTVTLLKSNLWHLDKIVAGILCGSVVANIKITYEGGSSNVFNRALNAPCDNIWTSSIIYTLYLALVGEYLTFSLSSLISSTLLLEAASISTTSIILSCNISLHTSHSLQGSCSILSKQFTALANIFAVDVLPVPLVPENK